MYGHLLKLLLMLVTLMTILELYRRDLNYEGLTLLGLGVSRCRRRFSVQLRHQHL